MMENIKELISRLIKCEICRQSVCRSKTTFYKNKVVCGSCGVKELKKDKKV
jgi:hypothetical protein